MLRVRAERAVERWRKSLIRAQGYQFPGYLKIEEHMAAALEEMDRTVQALARVPDSWKPAVGAVGPGGTRPSDLAAGSATVGTRPVRD